MYLFLTFLQELGREREDEEEMYRSLRHEYVNHAREINVTTSLIHVIRQSKYGVICIPQSRFSRGKLIGSNNESIAS